MRFPRWWTDSVTIYHRTESNSRVAWVRHTAAGCYFRIRGGVSYGQEYGRGGWPCICRLPPPDFAVSPGDIIVLGNVRDDIDEYQAGKRSADILAAHAGQCFTVRETRDNTHAGTSFPHLYAGGE